MCRWYADLWNDERTVGGNKLRTYQTFKFNFGWEDYLSVVTNRRHRIAMCRLRVSCHNLRIETGRYKRPQIPAEQRICLYCNSGMVDDEKHFITARLQDHTGLQRYFVQSCFKRQPCFSRIIRTREDVIYVHHHLHQRYSEASVVYIRMLLVQNVFYRHINSSFLSFSPQYTSTCLSFSIYSYICSY